MDKLLPCPFCGGEAEYRFEGYGEAMVLCRTNVRKCFVRGPTVSWRKYDNDSRLKARAVKLWNNRKHHPV